MANNVPEVGARAPDFELQDQENENVRLSDLRGQKVVLSFHPLAFTSVCQEQMEDLEDYWEDFEELNAVALGISVDQPYAKKAWAEEMEVEETALLADFWPHGEVARKYGIFDEEIGMSKRAVFIVDAEGRIAWKKIYPGSEVPDIEEIVAAVKAV